MAPIDAFSFVLKTNCILIEISLGFVPKCPSVSKSASVQIIALHCTGKANI